MKQSLLVLYAFTTITLYAQQPPENDTANAQGPATLAMLMQTASEQNDTPGNTPLHRVKNAQEAQALIQTGADINAQNNLHHTPLHIAVNKGLEDVVALLIQTGADTEVKDRWCRTPCQMAYTTKMVDFYTHCVEQQERKKSKDYLGNFFVNMSEKRQQ